MDAKVQNYTNSKVTNKISSNLISTMYLPVFFLDETITYKNMPSISRGITLSPPDRFLPVQM